MMTKQLLFNEIAELTNEHIKILDVAKLIAGYYFMDHETAARIVVKHEPVYMVFPLGKRTPAWINLFDINGFVGIKIFHKSDVWFGTPEYIEPYDNLYSLTKKHQGSKLRDVIYCELWSELDHAEKLFRLIREDIETVINGDAYVPPKIPISWPPSAQDLLKRF